MDNVAAAQRLAQPVAPGIGAMTVWYLVALVGTNAALSLFQWLGLSHAWALTLSFLLFLAAAVLCHRAYLHAKRALAEDPKLRGRWFVENAWWVLLIPFVAGFLVVVAILVVA